jgi:hypothetical protein
MGKQRSDYSKKRKFSGNQLSVNSKCLKTSEKNTASTSDENVSKSRSEDQARMSRVVICLERTQIEKNPQIT